MTLRFWLLVMDAMEWTGWNRGWMWALVRASNATEWCEGETRPAPGESSVCLRLTPTERLQRNDERANQ